MIRTFKENRNRILLICRQTAKWLITLRNYTVYLGRTMDNWICQAHHRSHFIRGCRAFIWLQRKVHLDNIWSSLCGHIDHNWCYFIVVLYKFISAVACNEKIKDQFLFNLSPPRQSFVCKGDTIHTSYLVFA